MVFYTEAVEERAGSEIIGLICRSHGRAKMAFPLKKCHSLLFFGALDESMGLRPEEIHFVYFMISGVSRCRAKETT